MDEAVYDRIRGGYRVFIGDLGARIGKYELEKEFKQYGPITDTWVARNPPGFAFLVFKYAEDAESAVRKLHGRHLAGRRIRVEHARPFEERRRLQMEERRSAYKPRYSRSRSRERYKSRRSRSKSKDRKSRSRSRDRKRSTSRSRSRRSKGSRRSRTRSRSGSPTESRKRKDSRKAKSGDKDVKNGEKDKDKSKEKAKEKSKSRSSSRDMSEERDKRSPSRTKSEEIRKNSAGDENDKGHESD